MVCLKAPEGCTHYSYQGVIHNVPEDGIVEVAPDAAVALQSHGFLPPALVEARADVRDTANLTREELHEMLGHLGFAVADSAIPAVKMVEMLKAAVKAKAEAVKKAEEDLKGGVDQAAADVIDTSKPPKKQRGN